MIGAIAGDIIGSVHEGAGTKTKDFPLFTRHNRFTDLGDGRTKWEMDSEFRFSGFMKVFAFFIQGAFPKATQKSMNMFKEFAEQ